MHDWKKERAIALLEIATAFMLLVGCEGQGMQKRTEHPSDRGPDEDVTFYLLKDDEHKRVGIKPLDECQSTIIKMILIVFFMFLKNKQGADKLSPNANRG